MNAGMKRVVVPNTVMAFRTGAFAGCRRLRRITFQTGVRLERIGRACFADCKIWSVVVPSSVRSIGEFAFFLCTRLCMLDFQSGSQLHHVGRHAFSLTRLCPENVQYPVTLKDNEHGHEW